ncbi:hypothetical protein Micbo1qcDRAFT_162978 [Microdochium bolleyi]|uniref:Uncharacterized protein n=1 Tax=Microdochium bolleyi TaxID=196109 RepID=A0A136J2L1_9PEZI|nr:hypothetical protein Micbo1qcDRAFT_162978 [Microdochium bolleyi]
MNWLLSSVCTISTTLIPIRTSRLTPAARRLQCSPRDEQTRAFRTAPIVCSSPSAAVVVEPCIGKHHTRLGLAGMCIHTTPNNPYHRRCRLGPSLFCFFFV